MDKPYTTYEEQVELLKKKGLIINDEAEAIMLLKKCSYYGLISGYKKPFKSSDKCTYKPHTTIQDIHALYIYDMELRELFLKYILIIENHVKSLISYSFCQTYGALESDYLNANNYNYISTKQEAINKLITKLSTAMCDYDSHPYLQHQRDNHGNIPLWVLTRVITIGMISKMYSLLKPQVQTLISKEFEYVTEGALANMIDLLSRFRNVCAHNERLYDYKYHTGAIPTTDVHRQMGLNDAKKKLGKKDLFAVVIVFKYLLPAEDFEGFLVKFDDLTKGLLNKTKMIQEAQILKLMGFPANWREIKGCEKKL